MQRDDWKQGGAEEAHGDQGQHRAQRAAPGKVTRTSKLSPGREGTIQRKAAPGGTDAAGPRSRSLWDFTMDPWMDAAHRGVSALSDRNGSPAGETAPHAQVVQRQADPLKQKKDRYYEQVAMLIIEVAQSKGISIEQAMFLVAQAQGEQGVGDPLKNKNRVFNAQATWAEEKDFKLNPREGIKTERLPSPEFVDGQWKSLVSPFFVYDTMEGSFSHFFDRLEQNHHKALEVLQNSKSTIAEYAAALNATKYGTDPKYVEKLLAQHKIVVRELNQFVDEKVELETRNIDRAGGALTDEWTIVERLWRELNELKGQKEQSTDDEHMAEIDQKIAEKEAELKEHESVLRDIESFLENRKGQLQKLTTLKEQMSTRAANVARP